MTMYGHLKGDSPERTMHDDALNAVREDYYRGRCERAERTRDCPFGHYWTDDGERAYHMREDGTR